jgi:formate hydrogenlyase subunit 3/multisubunit Na+/H+ antiporter MnhD subunit
MNNNTDLLRMFISMVPLYLPGIIVAVAAILVCLAKREQSPQGAKWALLGFGLSLFLSIAWPIANTFIQQWMIHGGGHQTERMWVYSAMAIVSSVLHALVYVFLLIAVFAGRSTPPEAASSSLYHP